jgi:hypothetical protein
MTELSGKIRLTLKKVGKSSGAPEGVVVSKENPKEKQTPIATSSATSSATFIATSSATSTVQKIPILVYVRWIEGSYCYIDEHNRNIYDGSNRRIGVMINHRRIDWHTYEMIEKEEPAMLEVIPV